MDPTMAADAGTTTRDRLLAAAEELASTKRWASLTMAEVARAAGVSRQTVYNEFGNKTSLGMQVALVVAMRLLAAAERELERHDDITEALAAAVELALRTAADEPLVAALLTGVNGEDGSLLPLVTTRGGPIVEMATATIAAQVLRHWPHLAAEVVGPLADIAVRLIVSHILQPAGDPADVGRTVAWMLARAAGELGTDIPPPS